MKNVLVMGLVMIVALMLTSLVSVGQENDQKKEGLKHITLVKENNGERVELDTFVEEGAVFVWQGDTVGKPATWVSKEGTITYDIKTTGEDGEKKVMVFSSSGENALKDKGAAVWVSSDGGHFKMEAPNAPAVFSAHGVKAMGVHEGNIIDLSDPGIISYKKKKLSGGRERIEIIRHEKRTAEFAPIPPIGMHHTIPAPPAVIKDRIIMRGENGNFHISDGEGEIIKSADGKNVYTIKTIKKGEGEIINIEEIEKGEGKQIKVIVNEIEHKGKQEQKTETENKEGGN